MLESLRNASKGWVAGILIFVLVGSFGFWGIQDWINVSTAPRIATVGDAEISPDQFRREFASYIAKFERETKQSLSTTEAKALNFDRVALDELLTREALLAKAKAMGLSFTDGQILDVLRENIGDGRGGIDGQRLQAILQQGQFTEAQFFDLVRADTLRSQMLRTITGGTTLPPGLERALHKFRLERRVAEYIVLEPAQAGDIKDPDEAQLKKFYEANAKQRYSAPEYRAFTFVTAKTEDVAAGIKVTEEEITSAYERARRFFETPEKRKIEQIKFKTEAAARAAKAKLDGGQTFEAVALAEGFKPEDIKLGEVAKTDTTIPPLAFELPVNKISDPVKGAFGWMILRVLSITPGTSKPIAEAREEIRKRFVEDRSKDALSELVNRLEDEIGGGKTIEEAAAATTLKAVKIVASDADGKDVAGQAVAGLPGGDFLAQVFAHDVGADSEISETAEGVRYVFRVDKVTPTAKKPFEQVRAQALSDWRADELQTRLTKLAEELVKKGNAGQSIESLASSLGLQVRKTDPLDRNPRHAVLGPDAVVSLGEVRVGKFFTGTTTEGQGHVVGRLANVSFVEEVDEDPTRRQYANTLRQVFAEDYVDQFSKAVRAEVGVKVDEEQFTKFHTNE
jgi:peptidyl-prolyl cis-trans isomerase D